LTIDTRKWIVTERDNQGRPISHDMTQGLPIVLRTTKLRQGFYRTTIIKNDRKKE